MARGEALVRAGVVEVVKAIILSTRIERARSGPRCLTIMQERRNGKGKDGPRLPGLNEARRGAFYLQERYI